MTTAHFRKSTNKLTSSERGTKKLQQFITKSPANSAIISNKKKKGTKQIKLEYLQEKKRIEKIVITSEINSNDIGKPLTAVHGKKLRDFAPIINNINNNNNNLINKNNKNNNKNTITSRKLFEVLQAANICGVTISKEMDRVVRTISEVGSDNLINNNNNLINNNNKSPIIVRRVVCKAKKERLISLIIGCCELAYRVNNNNNLNNNNNKIEPKILILQPSEDEAEHLHETFNKIGVPSTITRENNKIKNPPLNNKSIPIIAPINIIQKSELLLSLYKEQNKKDVLEFEKRQLLRGVGNNNNNNKNNNINNNINNKNNNNKNDPLYISKAEEITYSDLRLSLEDSCPIINITTIKGLFSLNINHCNKYNIIIINEPKTNEEEMYFTAARLLLNINIAFVLASCPVLAVHGCLDGLLKKSNNNNNNNNNDENNNDDILQDENSKNKKEEKEKEIIKKDLPISYFTTEGQERTQLLLSLLINSGNKKKIVLHCATPETCRFLCEMLYLLKIDKIGGFLLLCDSDNMDDKEEMIRDVNAMEARFDNINNNNNLNNLNNNNNNNNNNGGVVLLTAFGLVPKTAEIFVQYDPIISINGFVNNILINKIASSVANYNEYVQDADNNNNINNNNNNIEFKSQEYNYRHIILFLYPNEESGVLTLLSSILKTSNNINNNLINNNNNLINNNNNIKYDLLPQKLTKSVTKSPITHLNLQKIKSQNKKLFIFQLHAYEAYRSLMQVYTRLKPQVVYNINKLNINLVAEQFGYDEVPLLDIRSKDNIYRNRRDYIKAASIKTGQLGKRDREFADANIVGEGPDLDWLN